MKTKIIALAFACFSAVTLTGAEGQQPATGYLVCIEQNGRRLPPVKTTDIVEVTVLAEVYFPGNCTDFLKEFKTSPYYAIEKHKNSFSAEVKRITKHGKYRRLSMRQLKTMYPRP